MLLALPLILLPACPALAESYRMMVNHGVGWTAAGDFATPKACEQEAAAYAEKHSVQAGCGSVSAMLRWQNEVQFNRAADACAADAGVQLILKPGSKANILGTTQQRFNFDRCLAEGGQATVTPLGAGLETLECVILRQRAEHQEHGTTSLLRAMHPDIRDIMPGTFVCQRDDAPAPRAAR
jgi:hypothetical protein